MTRSIVIENGSQKRQLVWVEPEAQDYWLQPGETVELRADVETADANFEFRITDNGFTVFPSEGMSYISAHSGGVELQCGYQRPAGWA